MTPERWKKIKTLLEKAIELPAGSRASFLAENCDDPEMIGEVESFLDFEDADGSALEGSAISIFADNEAKESFLGRKIGRYEIVSELGVGGMGSVFLATRADGEFSQKVALKLIKSGLGSDSIIKRFYAERQILATLDHPNIAHLIDGGTTDEGLPYFVMEYIEGASIVDFARDHQLDLENRLDLFRKVCSGVAFAHQNLIIHRDLKPSNILVNKDGIPKLLDFGIAKLLKTTNDGETQTQHLAFTPDYASPEQIRGENLTTSTDVYSLGVVLYELLTGSRPFSFEGKNFGQIVLTATETIPLRPSAADSLEMPGDAKPIVAFSSTRLRGDLDNIVLKALSKDPARRYSSVEQFSSDIHRYLQGLPVFARRDSWAYRAEKFARRNPMVVGTIGLAFFVLIGGILATTYQARRANIERQKSEARFNDVRTLANSFMFEINEEITRSPIKARELLVERALQYLDKLAAESGGDVELKGELAAAYEKIGDVQSDIFRPHTGRTSEALLSHQKALKLREEVFAESRTTENSMKVALSHQNIGNAQLTSGRLTEAREHYSHALETLESASKIEPENLEVRRQLARSFSMVGQTIVRSGSLGEALSYYEKSLAEFQLLIDKAPENVRYLRSYGIVLSYIAFVKKEMGKVDEAVADYEKWLAIEKRLIALEPENVEFKHDLSGAYTWHGVALSEQGNIVAARQSFEEGIKIQQSVLDADKENLGELYSLADSQLEYGKAMAKIGVASIAIGHLESALAAYHKVGQTDKENLMTRHRIANSQRFLGDAYVQKNELAKAVENYEQAHAAFLQLTAFDPVNIDWKQDLAMTYTRLGEISLKKGDKMSALSRFRTALPIFETLSSASPDNAKRRAELEHIRAMLINVSG